VTLREKLNWSSTFSQPLEIKNIGFFSMIGVTVELFIHHLKIDQPGTLELRDTFSKAYIWNTDEIESSESRTITWDFTRLTIHSSEADLAFVVRYYEWAPPFIHVTKLFRFIGTLGSDGDLHFLPQPSDSIRDSVVKKVKKNDEGDEKLRWLMMDPNGELRIRISNRPYL